MYLTSYVLPWNVHIEPLSNLKLQFPLVKSPLTNPSYQLDFHLMVTWFDQCSLSVSLVFAHLRSVIGLVISLPCSLGSLHNSHIFILDNYKW